MTPENPSNNPASRRHFIKTSSAAVLGGVIAPYASFSGKSFAANSETLKVGLIGCGGRGRGAAAQALKADGNVALTAMGDVFDKQLQGGLKAIKAEVADDNKIKV